MAPREEAGTTSTEQKTRDDRALRLIDSVQDAEDTALEVVRKFLDTVDGVFPDVSVDGPRRKIIDSAFKTAEQLVGASNQLARRAVSVTEEPLDDCEKSGSSAKK